MQHEGLKSKCLCYSTLLAAGSFLPLARARGWPLICTRALGAGGERLVRREIKVG